MGMKKHAVMITSTALGTAYTKFKENPIAANFGTLFLTMHAFQVARCETEEKIAPILAGKSSPQVVATLAEHHMAELEALSQKIATGEARVVG